MAGFLLFGLEQQLPGYAVLVVSVVAFLVDRDLGKSLLLIGFGIGVIGPSRSRPTSVAATSC